MRMQVRNRNCQVIQRALKARIKCEAKAEHEVMWVPRELANENHKTSENRVKCKANHKPVCEENSPCKAKWELNLDMKLAKLIKLA